MYTSKTLIYSGNGWRLTSHGRGDAYLLEDTQNNTSVLFHGDGATEFESEIYDGRDGLLHAHIEDIFASYSGVMQ